MSEDGTACYLLISTSAIGLSSSLGLIGFYFVCLANSTNDDTAITARGIPVVVIVTNIVLWISASIYAGVMWGASTIPNAHYEMVATEVFAGINVLVWVSLQLERPRCFVNWLTDLWQGFALLHGCGLKWQCSVTCDRRN